MNQPGVPPQNGAFPVTPWSLVLTSPNNLKSLGALLQKYVEPLRVRAMHYHGLSPETARDTVQEMCLSLLKEESPLRQLHPAEGKFRTWLMACLRNTVSHAIRRENAERRGGGAEHIPLDPETGGATGESPDEAFDRAWAQQVYRNARDRFFDEAAGDPRQTAVRRLCLGTEDSGSSGPWEELSMSRAGYYREKARAAARFREVLHLEVASTLSNPAELEEEMRTLLRWLT